MESNAQQVGQKLKSEEYQCDTCKEWKVFNPWDAKGRIQPCPACIAKHPGIIQIIKDLREPQWTWIAVQAFSTFVVWELHFRGLAIGANFLVIFIVYAAREVWPEKK